MSMPLNPWLIQISRCCLRASHTPSATWAAPRILIRSGFSTNHIPILRVLWGPTTQRRACSLGARNSMSPSPSVIIAKASMSLLFHMAPFPPVFVSYWPGPRGLGCAPFVPCWLMLTRADEGSIPRWHYCGWLLSVAAENSGRSGRRSAKGEESGRRCERRDGGSHRGASVAPLHHGRDRGSGVERLCQGVQRRHPAQ